MAEISKVDVVGVGLNATDTVIQIAQPLISGEKIEHEGATIFAGGQTSSAVIHCQHWGLKTRYVGKIGDDAAGELHRQSFLEAGVDARLLAVPNCESQQSLIIVDHTGERTILHRRDRRLTLHAQELLREWVTSASILHVDGWDIDAAIQAATWAREAGMQVTCDLDRVDERAPDLLRQIDFVIGNHSFAQDFTHEQDLETALRRMHREFHCAVTAATLGEHGVVAWDGKELHLVPAFRVPVVDSTGAGDTFRAGFIFGLLQQWPLKQSLQFASAAAALNCTSFGARGNVKSADQVSHLVLTGEHYPMSRP